MPRKRNGNRRRRSPIIPLHTCDVESLDDTDLASCTFPSPCLTPRVFEVFTREILTQARSQSQTGLVQTLSMFLKSTAIPSVLLVPLHCPRKGVFVLGEVTGLHSANSPIHITYHVPLRGGYVSPRRVKQTIIRTLKDGLLGRIGERHVTRSSAGAVERLKRAKFRCLRLPVSKAAEASYFCLKRVQHVAYGIDVSGRAAYSTYEVRRLRRYLVRSLYLRASSHSLSIREKNHFNGVCV